MGYRNRFYRVEKELLDKIHHSSKKVFYQWGVDVDIISQEEANEEIPYLPLYEIGEIFFDFGKYYENSKEVQQAGIPLFKDKELSERYKEYEPFIVGKEALLVAIECEKNLIVKMYRDMLMKTDEERFEKDFDDRTREQVYKEHLTLMHRQWENHFNEVFAINLDENYPTITTSAVREYNIFELVRLYKATDWKKYGLIFMGW